VISVSRIPRQPCPFLTHAFTASKLIIGTNFGLPSACLCICIHLEQVASVRLARTSALDKRRRQIFEALMCFGLPIFFMGLRACLLSALNKLPLFTTTPLRFCCPGPPLRYHRRVRLPSDHIFFHRIAVHCLDSPVASIYYCYHLLRYVVRL
jgi:hypothetical protein